LEAEPIRLGKNSSEVRLKENNKHYLFFIWLLKENRKAKKYNVGFALKFLFSTTHTPLLLSTPTSLM